MKTDSYRTIEKPESTEINIKRSRFLAYAYPISSAEEALQKVRALEQEHYSATHVCWAYALDPEYIETRSQDNGEPSGTAGKPILGRLISQNITATLVAVVRYFGGVKLGTSGLIEAYKQSAEEVLKQATIREVTLYDTIPVAFPPHLTGEVMRVVKKEGAEIVSEDFDSQYILTLRQRQSLSSALRLNLSSIYGVQLIENE